MWNGVLYYVALLGALGIDQLTKLWIRMHMNVGDSLELWPGVLLLTRYENSGMAFGLLQGYGRWFVPVAVLLLLGAWYYKRRGWLRGFWLEMGAGLFIGGALGNAIDRVLFGSVTDFLASPDGGGILNLADHAIHFGVLFILMDSLISYVKSLRTPSV